MALRATPVPSAVGPRFETGPAAIGLKHPHPLCRLGFRPEDHPEDPPPRNARGAPGLLVLRRAGQEGEEERSADARSGSIGV